MPDSKAQSRIVPQKPIKSDGQTGKQAKAPNVQLGPSKVLPNKKQPTEIPPPSTDNRRIVGKPMKNASRPSQVKVVEPDNPAGAYNEYEDDFENHTDFTDQEDGYEYDTDFDTIEDHEAIEKNESGIIDNIRNPTALDDQPLTQPLTSQPMKLQQSTIQQTKPQQPTTPIQKPLYRPPIETARWKALKSLIQLTPTRVRTLLAYAPSSHCHRSNQTEQKTQFPIKDETCHDAEQQTDILRTRDRGNQIYGHGTSLIIHIPQ
jgi:hypothetical protein